MATVEMSVALGADADAVWALIGDFGNLPGWHPAIESSTPEDDGRLRRLTIAGGGGEVVERLHAHDDAARAYTYGIEAGAIPVADYVSTLRVAPSDAAGTCTVFWSASFTPAGVPEQTAIETIAGVYQAGLDRLAQMFGTA